MYPYSFIALDLAAERSREADAYRRMRLAQSSPPERPWLPSRAIARGFALLSRASAAVTRRLDECAADDLGRRLAPSE